ncbi:MAG: HipA N-terminal domain-containing protein, partial [Pseudomonadota bacterium]
MTSNYLYQEGYVWIWLPHSIKPIVAGKLTVNNTKILFNYGKSYLARADAIAINQDELPLISGVISSSNTEALPGCLRDASPGAWGRRVILNKLLGHKDINAETSELNEMTYLMVSGSDRIGALDFQASPTKYEPRCNKANSLETLLRAAETVQKGELLNEELAQALQHGTSIGGARPKAILEYNNKKYIA